MIRLGPGKCIKLARKLFGHNSGGVTSFLSQIREVVCSISEGLFGTRRQVSEGRQYKMFTNTSLGLALS